MAEASHRGQRNTLNKVLESQNQAPSPEQPWRTNLDLLSHTKVIFAKLNPKEVYKSNTLMFTGQTSPVDSYWKQAIRPAKADITLLLCQPERSTQTELGDANKRPKCPMGGSSAVSTHFNIGMSKIISIPVAKAPHQLTQGNSPAESMWLLSMKYR